NLLRNSFAANPEKMNKYYLSPRARMDLREIWHSVERWGTEQAKRYQHELRQALERLAADPRLGRSCEDIRPGYRRYMARSHMVARPELMSFASCIRVWISRATCRPVRPALTAAPSARPSP